MRVPAPRRIVQAVDTSAAQRAARVIPDENGSRLMMIWGRAMVGLMPGNWAFAARPRIADKKPIGKMSRPPRMKPLRAALAFLAPQAIWTGPWAVMAWVVMTMIQPMRTAKDKPPMGENQLKSAAGRAALMPLIPPSRRRMRTRE